VHAEGSWLLADGFNMEFTLYCERATLDFNFARGAEAFILNETGKPARVLPIEGSDGYGPELRYFVECIAMKRAPTTVTGSDAIAALEVCEAEERSVRTGKPMAL
jgi:predicted dehydrogenase